MLVWGWIPHLYPSFDMEYSPKLFHKLIKAMDGKKVHPNDDDPSETVFLEYVSGTKEFAYDEECFGFMISVGDSRLTAHITVFKTGLVCYRVDDANGLDEDKIRYAVREIYFAMKNLYHKDVHHTTDETGSTTMKYGDDNFTVFVEDNVADAVDSIFSNIIRKCENNLNRYRMVKPDASVSHSTMYLLTTGFITYGRNFISVNKETIGSRYEGYVQSLSCCAESLRALDSNAYNTSNYMMTDSTTKITQIANQISIRMLLLTFLSTGVAFFAGSIFADSLTEVSLWGKIAITAIAAVVVIAIGYAIWSWEPSKEYIKRKRRTPSKPNM